MYDCEKQVELKASSLREDYFVTYGIFYVLKEKAVTLDPLLNNI